jgi:glycosyltransferase involved in cell wall biosynthesis
MGAISFTLDPSLLSELQRLLGATHFVETGTFRGDSLAIAQERFAHCLSIEMSPEYHAAVRQRFAHAAHVTVLLGDSPVVLRAQRAVFSGVPTLFWLDAHWCAADNAAGEKSQCPLLEELAAIGPLHPRSAILIDDARLFLSAPPKPHEISAWPGFDAVLQGLQHLSDRHALVCFNDVLVFVPADILPALQPYLHEHTVNLLTLADKARNYDALLAQAKGKDEENASLLAQALEKDRENASLIALAREKDQENASLLAQALEKDRENELLITAAKEKDHENVLLVSEARGKDEEIARLKADLDRYLAGWKAADRKVGEFDGIIQGLRQELAAAKLLRERPEIHPTSGLRAELMAKESMIQELKQACNQRDALIKELATVGPNKDRIYLPHSPSFIARLWKRLRDRVLDHLAQASPHPLGKLAQYQPRPVVYDRLPRPAPLPDWPRICLITPSYQQGHFLERTMRSVLDQHYPKLAYGVQDGGSTDGSAELINQYVSRLYHAESSRDDGQAAAIQRGFGKLFPEKGDIMGWLNSDDMLVPGSLAVIGDYFRRHPDVDVVYGHRIIIDDEDREIGRWFLPSHHTGTLPWVDFVPQETLFWRSRCYRAVGGIDPSFHFAMDWDLLLRFEQAQLNIRRLPYFLGCFRVHTHQKTSAKITTLGEQEMQRLRLRTHGREALHWEIQKFYNEEVRRGAWTEWLYRHGLRR